MSTNTCLRCGRPTPDGFVCTAETDRARAQLAELADMVGAARDIATGQARHGGGSGSGKPGSRLPFDLGATQRLDEVLKVLTRWVDRIGTIRGTTRPWFLTGDDDPVAVAAHWLTDHLEWIRHQPDHDPDDEGNTWGADQFLTDVEACARVVRGLARGPSAQKYLGPCGALVGAEADVNPDDEAFWVERTCDGDVYAREGAQEGACRVCGAKWPTAERTVWLDGVARSWAYRAVQIADAYGISDDTIRVWAHRKKLKSYWRTEAGLTVEWIDPVIDPKLKDDELAKRKAEVAAEIKARGPRLHYVGDVLDLAAGDAARREEARATRARRAAARAAESEDAA